ncbi:SlyX family protein [Pararhodobacter sp. SW119]|uniref:SlyX family protein n=1 Tax=Pararhodobacter sp. SW119 TaxID=2780075 RepID=UPI001AE01EB6|nr:SlyX family protein [Pararhodobacter sp. SW119]
MSDSRLDRVEEQIAHLTRTTDDLSELLRGLTARLDRLERQLALLLDREAEREEGTGGSVLLADQRPPHW